MAVAHGRVRFGCPFGFQVCRQGGHHFGDVAVLEPLLLGVPPLIRLGRSATRGGGGQIFADVKVVAQKVALVAKHLPTLQANPVRAVAPGVDAAVAAPAGLPGAVPPTAARFSHTAKGGPVHGRGAVFGLRRYQAHLFPFAGAFPFPDAGRDRADHRAVRLGNHMVLAHRGQLAKRLGVFGLQLDACALGVFQRGRPDRAGVQRNAIVFQHTARGPLKGMFATEVGQHALQSPRLAARRHAQARGQGAEITLMRTAPDPVPHPDQPKDTPPHQRFFFYDCAR